MKKVKTQRPTWMTRCVPKEVREALEEATIDCYGEDEQASGLFELAAQELAFPFPGAVMGEAVSVVDALACPYDSSGLDLVVEYKKKRFAIAASSVELTKPLPEGHLYLAALLDWKSESRG